MNLGSSTVHAINSPHVRESKTVLDPPRGFWIPGIGFRYHDFLSVELEFRILISLEWDSGFFELYSRF